MVLCSSCAPASHPKTEVAYLSNDQLIAAYVREMAPARDDLGPLSDHLGAEVYCDEILHRGREIVPELSSLMYAERQSYVSAGLQSGIEGAKPFAEHILPMLVAIGDPRTVPAVLRLIATQDGTVTVRVRSDALLAIECLTHLTFRHIYFNDQNLGEVVEDPSAGWIYVDITDEEMAEKQLQSAAALYKHWLTEEGRDFSRWIAIACRRARAQLNVNDLDVAYCAVSFLNHSPGRDDNPKATARQISQIIIDLRSRRTSGQPEDPTVSDWEQALAECGAAAQP